MTGWYKNIYLGLSILCISKVSSKKTRNIPKTQKMIEKNLINLRTMKKNPSSTAIPKKHSKTERGFFISNKSISNTVAQAPWNAISNYTSGTITNKVLHSLEVSKKSDRKDLS